MELNSRTKSRKGLHGINSKHCMESVARRYRIKPQDIPPKVMPYAYGDYMHANV